MLFISTPPDSPADAATRRRPKRMRAWFSAYDVDEPLAASFRARQMQAMLRLTPAAMVVNIANALVVGVVLWGHVAGGFMLAWVAAVVLLAGLGLRGWAREQARPPRRSASRRAIRHAIGHAALLGAVWAALPLSVYGALDVQQQFFVGVVLTGMICAGGFALASLPAAATGWVLVLGAGTSVAVWRMDSAIAHALGLLLFLYSLIVVYSAWTTAKTFGARLVAEARADRQHEVIGLLLRDFEDHASDVLWELDAAGRLQHVSPRLAAELGAPAPWLQNLPALRLLRRALPTQAGMGAEARAAWQALLVRLESGTPFREHVIALQRGEQPLWWSLSARPLRDAAGHVVGWRGVAADVTERQLAHQRLSWMAHNDALTGLANRRHYRERLQAALAVGWAGTPGRAVAAVLFDMDGFKQVNDTLGHAAGDALLRVFGERLRAVVREGDTLARLGGDEFALLLPGVGMEQVQSLLERVFAALAPPADLGGKTVALRACAGVALAPRDGTDVDTLLGHADMALYAAKRTGGHRWCFFESGMHESRRRHAQLAQDLRNALERSELRLAYQPQVCAVSGRISGVEALLRWTHPEHGAVSPAEFIPIAEAVGLMPRLGRWVLEQACAQARQWPAALKVSVNVSARQLADAQFLDCVQAAVDGLQERRIELEVTESALVDDADAAVQTLNRLRELGVQLALDDFGTGYSALGYLRRFRFDTLKIDRSFVNDLEADGEARVIVETILAMTRALGLVAIAEGVETAGQARMLRERGCEGLQGFLFSRPLAAQDVLPFVQAWEGGRAVMEAV
ncbi:putative bifunctional diguanylate cyclase/phosphodiesterase [Azohydromonas lata]|uniref:EAL domain-containing protein n=1 Tax=Azohydromonas lata TaxID=45677 RepID=A0ABU5IM46_9BURK|nr:EAL domain-containing protein [Azohydromonas lata]MDZ5459975.1 EAL domain-containing protein [Azohydromonas lata]